MKQLILATAAPLATAFFNTHAGFKFFVCETPQPDNLSQADYEALTWVEVTGVGDFGETGSKTNILTYPTWGDKVVQKAKGMTDAGSPTVEVARDADDAGQMIMRKIAPTNYNYAYKIMANDAPSDDGTPTIRYNRGLIDGPTEPNGKNEDFDLEIFTLGLQQLQITVPAKA